MSSSLKNLQTSSNALQDVQRKIDHFWRFDTFQLKNIVQFYLKKIETRAPILTEEER